jgi:UTP--glucose-1-phosphate uridylyltransferase
VTHAAEAKMRREGLPERAIATFGRQLDRVLAGETGLLADADLEPVGDVADLSELPAVTDADALARAVVIKLNGGLGTSMATARTKSLIEAREGLSFLDLAARQVLALGARHRVGLPLVLMNSPFTREDTLAALERHRDLPAGLPPDFLQHRVPRLRADDLLPVSWPERPELEWCPPGHGDLYTALATSGLLEALLERGYRYAFVSNADNAGAVLDPAILAWFASERLPFLMEVVAGTEADRKGGHLARRADGRLAVRESAQTPASDAASFRDVARWRHYNTNNLWIDLAALAGLDGVVDLPLIVNPKTVDPGDRASPVVLQLETAMSGGIGLFEGARALRVPRTRFAPVKTTNDLLVLRSDVYAVREDARVEPVGDVPFVDLDPEHFGTVAAYDARFPHGPPSLLGCERFVVRGDVTFGRDVVARGRVDLDRAQGRVADGTVLGGAAPKVRKQAP